MNTDYSLKNKLNKVISTALVAGQLYSMGLPGVSYAAPAKPYSMPKSPVQEPNAEYGKSSSWTPLAYRTQDTTFTILRDAHVTFDKRGNPHIIYGPRTTKASGNQPQVYAIDIKELWAGGLMGGKIIRNYVVRNGNATWVMGKEGKLELIDAPRLIERSTSDSTNTRLSNLESKVKNLPDSSAVERISTRNSEKYSGNNYNRQTTKTSSTTYNNINRDTSHVSTPVAADTVYQYQSPKKESTSHQPKAAKKESKTHKDSLESKVQSQSDTSTVSQDQLQRVNDRLAKDFNNERGKHGAGYYILGALILGGAGYEIVQLCKKKDNKETGITGKQTGGPGIH